MAEKDGGLPVPGLTAEQLLALNPSLTMIADIEVENYSKVLSSQLTIEQIYNLAVRIREILKNDPNLAGIVVTHGTGALEESAWMTELMVDDERPVVFTGAMRSASDPYSDGPFNLLNAVRVAASPDSRRRGVMVVMNGVIHPARDVIKAHTTAVDAFQSGEFGPLGYVYPDRIHFAREIRFRHTIYTEHPEFNVDLIKFVVGMDERFIRASVSAGAKGIVIEGSGLGNVNDRVMQGIDYALASGVQVVVCSRSSFGRVFPAYGTSTGAAEIVKRGGVLASLPGQKTRILLMLLLGMTRDKKELQRLLDP